MRKWMVLIGVFVLVFVGAFTSMANGPGSATPATIDIPVAGQSGACSPIAIKFTYGPVSYTAELWNLVAVFEEKDGPVPGATRLPDPARPGKFIWRLCYNDNSSYFDSGVVWHAMGHGEDWGPTSGLIDNVLIDRALASASVSDGTVTLRFANRVEKFKTPSNPAGVYYQPSTWVVTFSDGKRAWGGHPGYMDGKINGPYTALNAGGSPLTAWKVDNSAGEITGLSKKAREILAQLK